MKDSLRSARFVIDRGQGDELLRDLNIVKAVKNPKGFYQILYKNGVVVNYSVDLKDKWFSDKSTMYEPELSPPFVWTDEEKERRGWKKKTIKAKKKSSKSKSKNEARLGLPKEQGDLWQSPTEEV